MVVLQEHAKRFLTLVQITLQQQNAHFQAQVLVFGIPIVKLLVQLLIAQSSKGQMHIAKNIVINVKVQIQQEIM